MNLTFANMWDFRTNPRLELYAYSRDRRRASEMDLISNFCTVALNSIENRIRSSR